MIRGGAEGREYTSNQSDKAGRALGRVGNLDPNTRELSSHLPLDLIAYFVTYTNKQKQKIRTFDSHENRNNAGTLP